MDIAAATEPSPGSPNDDIFITGPDFAVVLDGATAPRGRDSGCAHDVPWLVSRLSGHLVRRLRDDSGDRTALSELLARAIADTVADHADGCDITNPDSPSSTVTVLREHPDVLEYLVLGDSPLLWQDGSGKSHAIVDDRVERLPDYSYPSVARLRNHPDGFWVASTDPEAAAQAYQGHVPKADMTRALLLTDGAWRLIDRYGRSHDELWAIADAGGTRGVLREVRTADNAQPESARGKRFDDATVVLCRITDSQG